MGGWEKRGKGWIGEEGVGVGGRRGGRDEWEKRGGWEKRGYGLSLIHI